MQNAFTPIDRLSIPSLLKDCGISPTAQRIEVAQILLCARQHLSADQVLAKLGETGAAVSKATVYNTLGLFVDRGLIRQVIVDPTKVFYDSNVEAHHHFYNVDDGTLIDVDAAEIAFQEIPAAPSGTVTEAVDIVIRIRNLD